MILYKLSAAYSITYKLLCHLFNVSDNISPLQIYSIFITNFQTNSLPKYTKTKIMASGPITSWQIEGEEVEAVIILFFQSPKSLQMVTTALKLKETCSLQGKQ